MGGRGSSSSLGGGGIALRGLMRNYRNLGEGGGTASTGQWDSEITVAPFQQVGDYTDNNNPELLKWQGQTDDKSANFLARVDRTTDLNAIQSDTNDPWGFYDNPMQKFSLQMGLNQPTTVLSETDFNNYVKQTGSTVLYRGWSGDDAINRFENSPNSHTGNGINGDGYYYSATLSTAQGYGNIGQKAALSPNARVISVDAVNQAIANSSGKFKRSLSLAGSTGQRSFGNNEGQAQMALKMGYNTIDAGWAVIPLTRDAVVVSSKRITRWPQNG